MTETIHDSSQLETWDAGADDLWLVTAILQPFKLDAVTLTLEALSDFGGVTVSECRGFGREKLAHDQRQAAGIDRVRDGAPTGSSGSSSGDPFDFRKNVRLECAVRSWAAAKDIGRVIARTAHTGRPGDGKVWITRISGAISIRTFDVDDRALR